MDKRNQPRKYDDVFGLTEPPGKSNDDLEREQYRGRSGAVGTQEGQTHGGREAAHGARWSTDQRLDRAQRSRSVSRPGLHSTSCAQRETVDA